jgi:hypothetical protein
MLLSAKFATKWHRPGVTQVLAVPSAWRATSARYGRGETGRRSVWRRRCAPASRCRDGGSTHISTRSRSRRSVFACRRPRVEDRLVLHLARLAQIAALGRVADDEIGGMSQIGDDGRAHGAVHALVLDLDVGATAGLLAVQVGHNVRDSPIPTKYWHRPDILGHTVPSKLTWGIITGALIGPANAAATADPSAFLQRNRTRHHDGKAGQCCSNSARLLKTCLLGGKQRPRCYCCGQQRKIESWS